MARAEFILTEVWDEVEDLSIYATTLFIWSWTNPRCNMAGLYKVGRRAMTESKCPKHKLDGALGELAEARFAYYLEGVLWVRSRLRHLSPRKNSNPKMAKSVAKDVAGVEPTHPLRVALLDTYGSHEWLKEELAPLVTESRSSKPNEEGVSIPHTRGPDADADADDAADADVLPLRRREAL